jgi:hypothetical protein
MASPGRGAAAGAAADAGASAAGSPGGLTVTGHFSGHALEGFRLELERLARRHGARITAFHAERVLDGGPPAHGEPPA